ncbi:3-carboxy-cis,cis-muconate cycloisomerase [Mesorhizobium sp. Root157]|uniref:3-carboxy-cis,cis-muconate cycloisomerase n=1 Tax=Mesorhizobium sp. Root157 TaxID=1736477 RepID=UPI0006FE0B2A|nr:3-carboxy-cis,cis-muconate cycloisomerase [Mesorhizobium sp. Root157]KQZ82919.1 3-carboxy-cis,cis-muconate cycloisomerase [Mesorhizobium sp. Root157]
MSFSPFDHLLLSSLVGDEKIARYFSVEAEISAILDFERALAVAEAANGIVEAEAAAAIVAACKTFKPDMAALRERVGQDGVVVPELVRQLREAVGKPHDKAVHFGATSQDAIDTGLVLRLKPTVTHLEAALSQIIEGLAELEARCSSRKLMARTRMQPALPIKVSDRLQAWREPLSRHHVRLETQKHSLLAVQFGGAVGTLDKLGGKGPAVRASLAEKLGLADAPQWHSQRDRIAEFAGILSLVTASLGKIGQDIALMAQTGGEIELTGGGRSSAMPHKHNPVAAEVLVALARFNATQLSGMHQALVHEQERSGAAWTLEWLLLPQMVAATAGALRHAASLLGQIGTIGT